MPVRIRTITIDCHEPYLLSQFWSQVTGYTEDPDDPNLPEHTEALLISPGNLPLLFIKVPEDKTVKNRVHLDLTPDPPDASPEARDKEVARILGLGATQVDDQRRADGGGWVVLADPEGNEFCVERGVSGG
jgi:Glyoxalase-like domain